MAEYLDADRVQWKAGSGPDTSDFPIHPDRQHPGKPGLFRRPDSIQDPLHVVCPIFNAERYRSRWALYEKFADHIEHAGGLLYTIEAAYGDRNFAVTSRYHPRHIQLRTHSDLWLKEDLINVAVSRLPRDWRYVAWIDGDVTFVRPDVIGETLHALQRYALVQMFSEAYDLSSTYKIIQKHFGFAYCFVHGIPESRPGFEESGYYYLPQARGPFFHHPGFCWAARRDAWDTIGGLINWAILGAGDQHMARALIGQGDISCHPRIHPNYRNLVLEWERRASALQRNIGYIDGAIHHAWHGPKPLRKYATRWNILVESQYDPVQDVRRDWQGLPILNVHDARTQALRDRIRTYFAQRAEDQISTESVE